MAHISNGEYQGKHFWVLTICQTNLPQFESTTLVGNYHIQYRNRFLTFGEIFCQNEVNVNLCLIIYCYIGLKFCKWTTRYVLLGHKYLFSLLNWYLDHFWSIFLAIGQEKNLLHIAYNCHLFCLHLVSFLFTSYRSSSRRWSCSSCRRFDSRRSYCRYCWRWRRYETKYSKIIHLFSNF